MCISPVGRYAFELEPDELALVPNDSSETILTVVLLALVAIGVLTSVGLGFWHYRAPERPTERGGLR